MAEGEGSPAPVDIMQGVEAAYLVQHAQELQKRLNSPELKPSLIEQFMATKGFKWGLEQKALQRQQLLDEQGLLAKHFVQTNQPHMLSAIYQTLKPEEIQQLIKTDAATPRMQVARAFQNEVNAPIGGDLPATYAQAQGQPSNIAPEQAFAPGRPPTPAETVDRYGPALTKFLPAIAATQGRTMADLFKAQEESRTAKMQQMTFPLIQRKVQEATGQAPPVVQEQPMPAAPITSTPLPTMPVQSGTMAQRNNNPLNIKAGAATQQYLDSGAAALGPAATDGGNFLRFRSPVDGMQAGVSLLQSPVYADLTVDQALRKWSNNGYGAEIVKGQLQPDAKIKDLSPNDITALTRRMAKQEGYTPTQETQAQVAGPGAPTSTQAPAQPYVLPSYKPSSALDIHRMTVSGKGEANLEFEGPTREDQSAAYMQQAIMQGGWRQFMPAMNQVSAKGDQPRAERFTQLAQQASNQAYWEFRDQLAKQDPTMSTVDLHQKALEMASHATNGFFSGQQLGDLRDPVALKYAETQAGFVAPLEGDRTRAAAEEEQRRAGARTKETTIAGAEGTTQAQENQRVNEVIKAPSHAVYTGQDTVHGLLKGFPLHAQYGRFTEAYDKGHADVLSDDEFKTVQSLGNFGKDLNIIVEKLNTIYGPGGLFEKATGLSGRAGAAVSGHIQGWTQSDPAFVTAEKEYRALLTTVARRLGSEVGRIPVQEIANYYVGILPKLEGLPDSPAVARGLVEDIQRRLGEHIGSQFTNSAANVERTVTGGLTKPTFGVGTHAIDLLK